MLCCYVHVVYSHKNAPMRHAKNYFFSLSIQEETNPSFEHKQQPRGLAAFYQDLQNNH